MLNTGKVKNQAELARIKASQGQRLDKSIINNLEQIGYPTDRKILSEKELRKIIHQS